MKLVKTGNVEKKELIQSSSFDAIIASIGYEERATNLISQLNIESVQLKYAIAFKNSKSFGSRRKNDTFFKSKNFKIFEETESGSKAITLIVDQIFDELKDQKNISILVDYSCMTRVWYAKLLEILKENQFLNKNIRVNFGYSPSDFVPAPKHPSINTKVGPIEGFSTLSIPSKPTAIIIGLGYEALRAYGLNEYLDAEPFVFYSDSRYNPMFSREVEKNNQRLLESVNPDHIFKFPLNDTKYTEVILSQLCEDLLTEYRVILAPCGPKPFTLLCLIIACRIPNIDVWRISAGESASIKNKKCSSKDIIIHFVDFVED